MISVLVSPARITGKMPVPPGICLIQILFQWERELGGAQASSLWRRLSPDGVFNLCNGRFIRQHPDLHPVLPGFSRGKGL